jgi:hypothetical protein
MTASSERHGRRPHLERWLILGVACVLLALSGTALANFPDAAQGWHASHIGPASSTVAVGPLGCPSRSLCLGPGGSGPSSVVRGNPLGGSASWTEVPGLLPAQSASQYPQAIACPSTRVCAVAYVNGLVAATGTPNGTTPWTTTTVSTGYLNGISCTPQASLCVTTGKGGIYASTDPASPYPTWRQISRVPARAVSCPSVHLCAVVGLKRAQILVSTNPTARTVRWTQRVIQTRLIELGDISCATNRLCVAADFYGKVVSSTRPSGPASAWKIAYPLAKQGRGLGNVSCVAAHLCIVSENIDGKVLLSNDPTGGKRAWKNEQIGPDEQPVTALCQSTTLCVALDDIGDLLYNTHPIAGLKESARVDPTGNP